MICDSSAVLNSSATDTTMSIPVALNEPDVLAPGKIALRMSDGIRARRARNIAPKRVSLSDVFLR